MELNEDRLKRRWWLISRFDLMLDEIAYYRKFNEEMQYPKTVIWHWEEKEARTELDVDPPRRDEVL